MDILIAIGLALAPLPVSLEHGVHETQSRNFDLPVLVDDEYRKMCACIRLWFSEDRGKSWKQYQEISATGTRFSFKAPRDGHYWFILQTVTTNGQAEPPNVHKAIISQKVYVNQAKRLITRQQPEARLPLPLIPKIEELTTVRQLRRESEETRTVVNQLRKRMSELENSRNQK
jgi:hypothetical protein